jgi:DNA-binding PadR family transcriptional regulator
MAIEAGLNTPYRIRASAGISVGGVIPALRKLEARQLVQRGAYGSRRKQEFTVTSAGQRALRNFLEHCSEEALPKQWDDLLRFVAMAQHHAHSERLPELLRHAAQLRLASASTSAIPREPTGNQAVEAYVRMRQDWEVSRLRAEASFLRKIARRLPKRKAR